jgi:hypothetical protein
MAMASGYVGGLQASDGNYLCGLMVIMGGGVADLSNGKMIRWRFVFTVFFFLQESELQRSSHKKVA